MFRTEHFVMEKAEQLQIVSLIIRTVPIYLFITIFPFGILVQNCFLFKSLNKIL